MRSWICWREQLPSYIDRAVPCGYYAEAFIPYSLFRYYSKEGIRLDSIHSVYRWP